MGLEHVYADEPAARRVDWDRIHAQLADISEEFKDISRFNLAPQVLKVLGSEDWQYKLEKVNLQRIS
jgi:hypothetical protein